MVLFPLYILTTFTSTLVTSQDCSTAYLGQTDPTETISIYNNEFALSNDHVTYEFSPEPPSSSFDKVSDSVRVMTSGNISSTCPTSCTITLTRYTDSLQGDESTTLYFDSDHSYYLPQHYVKDPSSSFSCSKSNGACGASIPIYRYYKITTNGVYHAYSFNRDESIDDYNQEYIPLCYAWPILNTTGLIFSRPTCGNLKFVETPVSTLTDLSVYENNLTSVEKDHYYTTEPAGSADLVGYNKTGVIGKVLTSSKNTDCTCLVKLQQQYDNQTGYFHRIDHKLIVNGEETNRPYEQYVNINESIYCSKRLGDCGATLPLWKFFNFYNVDSMLATTSDPIPYTYVYPQTPLCYIWPSDYAASGDPSITPSVLPTVPVSSGVTTGSVASSVAPTVSTTVQSISVVPTNSVATSSVSPTVSAASTAVNFSSLGPVSISNVSGTTAVPASTQATNGITTTTLSSAITTGSPSNTTGVLNSTSVLNGGPIIPLIPIGSPTIAPVVSSTAGTASIIVTTAASGSSLLTLSSISAGSGNVSTTATVPSGSGTQTVTSSPVVTATVGVTGTGASTVSSIGQTTAGGNATSGIGTTTLSSAITTRSPSNTTGVLNSTSVLNGGPIIPLIPIGSPTIASFVSSTAGGATVSSGSGTQTVTSSPLVTATAGVTGTGASTVSSIGQTTKSILIVSNSTATLVTSGSVLTTTTVPAGSVTQTVTSTPHVNGTGASIIPLVGQTTAGGNSSSGIGSTTVSTPVSLSTVNGTVAAINQSTTHSPSGATTTNVGIETTTVSTGSHNISVTTTSPFHNNGSTGTLSILEPKKMSFDGIGGETTSEAPKVAVNPPHTIIKLSDVVGQNEVLLSEAFVQTTSASNVMITGPLFPLQTTTEKSTNSSTEEPDVISKAGAWLSDKWNSVFGKEETNTTETPSTTTTTTTPKPIAGLVGSILSNDTKEWINDNILAPKSTNTTNSTSSFNLGDFVGQKFDEINNSTFLNDSTSWVSDKIGSAGDLISGLLHGEAKNETEHEDDKGNSTSSFVDNSKAWIGDTFNNTKDWVGDKVDTISDEAGDIVNNTGTFVQNTGGSIVGGATNLWNGVTNWIGDKIGGGKNETEDAVETSTKL